MSVAWKYSADVTEAVSELMGVRVRAAGSALERAVARLAGMMETAARGAFGAMQDPRTGRAWAAPAARTQADPRFRSLLRRTGALQGSVRGQYRVGPGIGTAGLAIEGESAVIRYGMVHLYGVKPGARRRKSSQRSVALPARRFVGFPKSAYAAILDRLKRDLMGEP